MYSMPSCLFSSRVADNWRSSLRSFLVCRLGDGVLFGNPLLRGHSVHLMMFHQQIVCCPWVHWRLAFFFSCLTAGKACVRVEVIVVVSSSSHNVIVLNDWCPLENAGIRWFHAILFVSSLFSVLSVFF